MNCPPAADAWAFIAVLVVQAEAAGDYLKVEMLSPLHRQHLHTALLGLRLAHGILHTQPPSPECQHSVARLLSYLPGMEFLIHLSTSVLVLVLCHVSCTLHRIFHDTCAPPICAIFGRCATSLYCTGCTKPLEQHLPISHVRHHQLCATSFGQTGCGLRL